MAKEKIAKSIDPRTDSSGFYGQLPNLNAGMKFTDYGSLGLRQFGGWVREEFLQELIGRQGARTYREMLDNSAQVGGMMFAIQQSMRRVNWRIEPANDSAEAEREAEFVDSLREDMSHSWGDFITEALTMLPFGYSLHEIVYKRRLGKPGTAFRRPTDRRPSSKYNDGRIGWRRLPIRSQEIVLKWFFDENGQVRGVTQQPWIGGIIDIPIEKLLLFRPIQYKNNPEGRSVLRNAYRSFYFVKRLEEMEAIMIERMSGLPVIYLPSSLIDAANAPVVPGQTNPAQANAMAAYNMYKDIVTGVRVNEQMGALFPSDCYKNADGSLSNVRMYEFALVTPQHGRQSAETNVIISRHKLDMLMTLLCDFLTLGHEVRGTNNLAVTRVDMFYSAIEGWLTVIADVLSRFGLARLWEINGLNPDLMPRFVPDMPARLDLDSLGTYIKNTAQAGMPWFPNDELQEFITEAAGLPEIDLEGMGEGERPISLQEQQQQHDLMMQPAENVKKALMAAFAKRALKARAAE